MVDNDAIEGFQNWNPADLTDPELLPTGKRYLGDIVGVDTKEAVVGAFRQFNKPLKDGRTEVPIVSFTIKARKAVDGSTLAGQNLMTTLTQDFWIGSADFGWRQALSRLVASLLGKERKGMTGNIITDAEACAGGKVSFEVNHREYVGNDGQMRKQQQPAKLKAASSEEMALLM